jgi:hypothetical protein
LVSVTPFKKYLNNKTLLAFLVLNLPCDLNLLKVLIALGRTTFVPIIKRNGDTGLRDARMTLFVDQFLQVVHPRQREGGKTQHEQDCVHYVRFAGTVQTSYRVELFVEIGDYRALRVGFETIDYQFFYVHFKF